MKKVLFTLSLFFMLIINVNASSKIDSINMYVMIDEYGKAYVNEVWKSYSDNDSSYTEMYKTYNNLNYSSITNFKVKDSDESYIFTPQWNTKGNFESKKYKNGINYISDGLELCFGISKRGDNVYYLSYEINNFVNILNDSATIYYRLMPPDLTPSPKNVKIVIDSYYKLDNNNSKIWSYGYDGTINYDNGSIVLQTNKGLNSSDYMTALIKLDKNMYSNSAYIYKTFDELKKDADSTRNFNISEDAKVSLIFIAIIVGFMIVIFLINSGFRLITCFVVTAVKYIAAKYRYAVFMNTELNNYDYIRDFDNVDEFFVIGHAYNEDYLYNEGNVINAILLKMYLDNDIMIIKDGKKDYSIDLKNLRNKYTTIKEETYMFYTVKDYLFKASLDSDIVSKKQINSYFKKNNESIRKDLDEYYNLCSIKLNENEESMKKGYGIVRFLRDFSSMQDKNIEDINLWNKYLILATGFGISININKYFNNPDLIEFIKNDIKIDYLYGFGGKFSHDYHESINHHSGFSKDYSSSYSSGSGGSSYSGGGSSASGGGSSSGGGGMR